MFARPLRRVVCNRENGLGLRLTYRGSIRLGLLQTRIWAINTNNPAVSSGASERSLPFIA